MFQLLSRHKQAILTRKKSRVRYVGFLIGNPYETRVARSIGFVDLSGFTRFTHNEGDSAAVETLMIFRVVVREVCARHGVRIAKWLGDGAMMVAVEAEPLAEALTELQLLIRKSGVALPLKAGVATGPVILFEGDDYIGSVVNLAARLSDLAEPGQILAPASFVTPLMLRTIANIIGPMEIPGFDERIDVVSLVSDALISELTPK